MNNYLKKLKNKLRCLIGIGCHPEVYVKEVDNTTFYPYAVNYSEQSFPLWIFPDPKNRPMNVGSSEKFHAVMGNDKVISGTVQKIRFILEDVMTNLEYVENYMVFRALEDAYDLANNEDYTVKYTSYDLEKGIVEFHYEVIPGKTIKLLIHKRNYGDNDES